MTGGAAARGSGHRCPPAARPLLLSESPQEEPLRAEREPGAAGGHRGPSAAHGEAPRQPRRSSLAASRRARGFNSARPPRCSGCPGPARSRQPAAGGVKVAHGRLGFPSPDRPRSPPEEPPGPAARPHLLLHVPQQLLLRGVRRAAHGGAGPAALRAALRAARPRRRGSARGEKPRSRSRRAPPPPSSAAPLTSPPGPPAAGRR